MLESQDTYTKQQYNEPEKMHKEQLRGVKNRSAALGRLAMKLLEGGGGGAASTSLRSTNPRP